MAIENFQRFPLRYAYDFLEEKGFKEARDEFRASTDQYRGRSTGVRRAKVVRLLDQEALMEEFIERYWPNGASTDGQRRLQGLRRLFDRFHATDEGDEDVEEEDDDQFAYEEDLKNYLARNLSAIEPGLELHESGVEFAVGEGKRIDILARDSRGTPVVIELKVSRGYERVIGQVLYYRSRIKEMTRADRVRAVIVAREISDRLRIATRDLPDIQLFEYGLQFRLRPISPHPED